MASLGRDPGVKLDTNFPLPSTDLTEQALAVLMSQLRVVDPATTSPITSATPITVVGEGVPLRYLDTFADFEPDHKATLRQEINRLARIRGWGSKRARKELFCLAVQEFCHFQGQPGDKLREWQLICSDLNVNPIPVSITQCKKALKHVYVNIEDYINCKRAGTPVHPIFTSLKKFRSYTINTGKIFPKSEAKKNALLKEFLEPILVNK